MPEIQDWWRVTVFMPSGLKLEVFVDNRQSAELSAANFSQPNRRTIHSLKGFVKQGNRIFDRTIYVPAHAAVDGIEITQVEPQLVFQYDPDGV